MEREDRAPVGTFYAPGAWSDRVEPGEGAAHHAHVKRFAVGDLVRLSSGDGRRAIGEIAELSKRCFIVSLDTASIETVMAPARVDLWAPVGDRDRMLLLAEKSVELGAAAWQPVMYARSRSVSPRGEGDSFREKLRLRMIGALEQCGGAWLPERRADATLDVALAARAVAPAGVCLLLDGGGEPIGEVVRGLAGPVRIALGPEGGLEPEERAQFIRAGWRAVSLGRNVLRFETAGIAALAIVRSHLR